MTNDQAAGSERENRAGTIGNILFSRFQTRDYYVFSVYRGNRHWKRLARRKRPKTPKWVECLAGEPSRPAIEADLIWLNKVRENPANHIELQRFPRTSNELWKNLPCLDPNDIPKTKWLIKSFLAERSIQLVFGERGSFKSTLLLAAAKAVANGEDFLGMKTRRRRVLYLDYENPANVIKARNDDLGLDLSNSQNLKVWNRFGSLPTPRPDDPWLEAMIRECILETGHGPWIIFDSWASLLKPGEGGEFTGQIAPIYLCLRKLADAGATVTIIDHTKKDDRKRLYGGADKEAKADSIHTLLVDKNKRKIGSTIVCVETWLKRAAPEGEGAFAFEVQSRQDADGDWHITGLALTENPEEAKEKEEVKLFRDLIRHNPNSGQEALARLATAQGISRDRAISLLKSGVGKFWKILRTNHGRCCYSVI